MRKVLADNMFNMQLRWNGLIILVIFLCYQFGCISAWNSRTHLCHSKKVSTSDYVTMLSSLYLAFSIIILDAYKQAFLFLTLVFFQMEWSTSINFISWKIHYRYYLKKKTILTHMQLPLEIISLSGLIWNETTLKMGRDY